ncbi:hypothetical protein AB4304_00530 [Vibrio breoganii]|nr:hypothetical protein F0Z19_3465 [Vibrio cyclitrophicus]CAH6780649.1 conserved hypothetical protein [Vibrio chagasii]CAH6865536.1 conserved hypothetical protein [Vibrio chagasii]CAH6868109.1 conserved hypothetical protein [Vibrio chagasii]CAH7248631.1 conserved hypothetical protein [Vibrio chagasii]
MFKFLKYRNLSSDAVARIEAAEKKLNELNVEYKAVVKKLHSGECDEADHRQAFEAREQARSELDQLREEEFQYREMPK